MLSFTIIQLRVFGQVLGWCRDKSGWWWCHNFSQMSHKITIGLIRCRIRMRIHMLHAYYHELHSIGSGIDSQMVHKCSTSSRAPQFRVVATRRKQVRKKFPHVPSCGCLRVNGPGGVKLIWEWWRRIMFSNNSADACIINSVQLFQWISN